MRKVRLPSFQGEGDPFSLEGQGEESFEVGEDDAGFLGQFPLEASVIGGEVVLEAELDRRRGRRTVEVGVFVDEVARANLAEVVDDDSDVDGVVVESVLATLNQVCFYPYRQSANK